MYPPQTSLIPVTVALARYFEEQGISAFFQNYPYWYLGTTTFRYLTGPVVPLITVGLHKIFSAASLFDISIWLIIVTYVLSAFGWLVLINAVRKKRFGIQNTKFLIPKGQALLILNSTLLILLLVLPWRLFSSLAFSEVSFAIARNLLPWALLAFWKLLVDKTNKTHTTYTGKLLVIIALSFLLLINTSILPIFLVGLASLILAASFRKGKFRRVTKLIKLSLFLILTCLLLVTFYYTPGYWITILANPSIGGASGFKVIVRIIDLLKASVPLLMAIIAVYFSGKLKNRISIFTLVWFLTFGFLTLFRLISDPDFWMDWTAWFSELEIGLALLLSINIAKILRTRNYQFSISKRQAPLILNYQSKSKLQIQNTKKFGNWSLILVILLILPFYLTWRFHLALGKPKLISREIPQGVQSLEKLNEIVSKDKAGLPLRSLARRRVFLSGSTVFWANALYDIYQVRGGRDQVADHPTWDKAAYELREGSDPQKSLQWLNDLNLDYVLIHGSESAEYYHDFRYIDKWDEIGKAVWVGEGDRIIKIVKN